MGNRACLYIQAKNDDASANEVAQANNNFPVLWQVLLAEGVACGAITYQRVFGDAGTDNLCSDTHAALARISKLAAAIVDHPELPRLPQLELQFKALVLHLSGLIHDMSADGAETFLSADLDELSWLDGEQTPAAFIEDCRDEATRRWFSIEACIDANDPVGLLVALDIARFDDWEAWAWSFGLAGISHRYFEDAVAPSNIAYDAVTWNGDDEDEDGPGWDNHLEDAWWRFQADDGRWGVHWRSADEVSHLVVAAEWDEIIAAHAAPSADGAIRVWAGRDQYFALLAIDEQGVRILLSPMLDEVWDFEEQNIAAVRQGAHLGWLRADGSWLFEPQADELFDFANGYGLVQVGDRLGYLDETGRWAIAPRFGQAEDFAPCGLAPVFENGAWGLITGTGSWAAAPEWDALDWDDALHAFVVQRGKRVGLIDKEGGLRIEPVFLGINALSDDDTPDEGEATLAVCQAFTTERFIGLCDTHGRVLVPFEYVDIAAIETLPVGACVRQARDYVYVARQAKERDAPWLYGVYDMTAGRETVPCDHQHLQCLHWGDTVGWLTAELLSQDEESEPDGFRLGILRDGGEQLHPPLYAWIATPMTEDFSLMSPIISDEINKAWSVGEPVQAARYNDGLYVWLHADGRVQAHADYMQARVEAGCLAAAQTFALQLRDGEGVIADAQAARRWMAVAAGVPSDVVSPPSFWRRFLRLHPQVPLPAQAAPGGQPAAMRELALMLLDGDGGEADPTAARAWLEHAVALSGGDARTHALLGYALCREGAAPADIARGVHHYEIAAAANDTMALYNLGLIHKVGTAGTIDAARAMDCFRRADGLGALNAAYFLGILLRTAAGADDATQTAKESNSGKTLIRQAAYYLQKAAAQEEGTLQAWACYALGDMARVGEDEAVDIELAQRWFIQGAESPINGDADGHHACMEALATVVYGDPDSALYNEALARQWRERRQAAGL